MLYIPLQVGLPPARGAELATIKKYVTDIFVCHKTEMSTILNLLSPHVLFRAQSAPKPDFRPGLRPGPQWRSLRCSPRLSSRLGRVHPSQTLHHRRLRVSIFGTRISTFGASIVLPYQIFNPGAASAPYYVPPTVQRDRRHMFI